VIRLLASSPDMITLQGSSFGTVTFQTLTDFHITQQRPFYKANGAILHIHFLCIARHENLYLFSFFADNKKVIFY